jgi:hypothetical protein
MARRILFQQALIKNPDERLGFLGLFWIEQVK